VSQHDIVNGIVLDERVTLTLREVCEVCGLEESLVVEMVGEGVALPLDESADQWVFSGLAVARLRTARRLQRDLHVNLAGAALALELLEEIRALKARGD
jgi:chaperone modulatory protein CbpM